MGLGEKIVAGAVGLVGGPEDLLRKVVAGFKELVANYKTDAAGNLTGGYTKGRGIYIAWQDGARGQGEDRVEANGASVEDVIRAVKHRIEGFQKANGGKLDCEQNRVALANLNNALKSLEERSRNRKTREVEGTYQP